MGDLTQSPIILDELVIYPTQKEINNAAATRARKATKPNYNFEYALDLTSKDKKDIKNKSNWDYKMLSTKILESIGMSSPVYNCINTATSWINPYLTVARNSNMYINPEKYGYVRVPADHCLPGDLVLIKFKESKYPIHAGVVTGIDKNGNVIVRSSEGSSFLLPEKSWGNFRGGTKNNQGEYFGDEFIYYRYSPKLQGAYRNHNGTLIKYK